MDRDHAAQAAAFHTTPRPRRPATTHSGSQTAPTTHASAVVAGAGPGGIAAVGTLLSSLAQSNPQQQPRLFWTDPTFTAGRIHAHYRSVPSNTKAALFLDFARAVPAFESILDSTPAPNAVTRLESLPQDRGCDLGMAADMCLMLTEGLAKREDVMMQRGTVRSARLDWRRGVWTVVVRGEGEEDVEVHTPRLVLCTGSRPIDKPVPEVRHYLQEVTSCGETRNMIPLDTAIDPALLAAEFEPIPASGRATVAVVGASHSAILVLMNLVRIARSQTTDGEKPELQIRWFTRHHALRYAEYMDGWILRDNTGLKGAAAEWARANLEFDADEFARKSPVGDVVEKIWTGSEAEGDSESEVYMRDLSGCTHVVQAVGYQRNEIPELSVVGEGTLDVEFDPRTGRFWRAGRTGGNGVEQEEKGMEYVPGLFGAGIAFPERLTDPAGNVEDAVGFWKFMRFLKRVVPEWTAGGKP